MISVTGRQVRAECWRFAELLALCGLAITQPLLDLFGRNPDQFARRAGFFDAVFFALGIAIVPAAVLFVVTLALRLVSPRAETMGHRVALACLGGLAVIQAFPRSPLTLRWTLGTVAAVVLGVLSAKVTSVQIWTRWLSVAPVGFVALFLFASDVTPVLFPNEGVSKGAAQVGNPIPVVWVTFDELPLASLLDGKGGVDADLFPNFARLAARSTWFRNATTVSPNTAVALPGLLTGSYPERDGSIAGRYPDSVFTALSGTYHMNVQEPVSRVCPRDLCEPFTGDMGSSVGELWGTATRLWLSRLTGEEVTEQNRVALDEFVLQADGVSYHDPARLRYWISQLRSEHELTFHFLHAVLPHFPWIYTPSGYRYDNQPHWNFERAGIVWSGAAGVEDGQLRHLLQLQYVDAWLGAMLDELEATGLWDTALVVVTADHGVSFHGDGYIRGVDTKNPWEIMWVPLFIHGPGFRDGVVNDEDATVLDIVPTIADVLDLELPWTPDGVSLLQQPLPERPIRLLRRSQFNLLKADENGYVSIDARREFPKVLEAPKKGEGNDDLRLWRTGKYAPLVGKPISAMKLVATVGEPVELSSPSLPVVFDPNARDAPVSVIGRLPAKRDRGTNLAIALNGTIVATPLFSQANRTFATLLPETRLSEGENDLRIFLLTGPPEKPTAVEFLLRPE
ncbi:MAG: sulfatase-like hydrolase/transferase [Acidimicrobiales bacterium]|nr:sulfatase-like hydrolase/transferase [Acidimicrobiales bacterium]